MTSMLDTITPKSDQLNADDLIGGQTKTIKVTSVSLAMGEQPVSIHYDGDNGKPYKPGKSMRRVLVNCWGADANLYVGRLMTLYRDEKVKFAGIDVGGIRISHLSDIKGEITLALTTTKTQRKPFTVKPLMGAAPKGAQVEDVAQSAVNDGPGQALPPLSVEVWISDIESIPTLEGLKHKFQQAAKQFKDSPDFARIYAAKEKRKAELTTKENTDAGIP